MLPKFKTGRPRIWETPQDMEKDFQEYVQHVIDNPFLAQDFVGKDAEEVNRKKARPVTIEGFAVYMGMATNNFYEYKDKGDGFTTIITRIKDFCYSYNYDLATAGFLNTNLVAYKIGLNAKVENPGTDKPAIEISLNLG
jgi:hypothetical protein